MDERWFHRFPFIYRLVEVDESLTLAFLDVSLIVSPTVVAAIVVAAVDTVIRSICEDRCLLTKINILMAVNLMDPFFLSLAHARWRDWLRKDRRL